MSVTGVVGTSYRGLLNRTLLNGVLVYPNKVKCIVLKTACHWDSKSSVLNDPLVEPDRTPLYVGFWSRWASWTVTEYFRLCIMDELFNNWEIWEIPINYTNFALETVHLNPVTWNFERDFFSWEFERSFRYRVKSRSFSGAPSYVQKKALKTGTSL